MMLLSTGMLTYYSKQPSSRKTHHSAADMTVSPNACFTMPLQTGFKKVTSIKEPSPCPIPGLGSGVLEMRVKEGSKIQNLLRFAISHLTDEGHVAPVSQVMFTGLGRAITKTITCAEIVKRKVRGLHQVSKLQHRNIQEVWENQEGESVRVRKTVASICILLSKEPLDPQESGYQAPNETNSSSDAGASATTGKRHFSHSSHLIMSNAKRTAMGHVSPSR